LTGITRSSTVVRRRPQRRRRVAAVVALTAAGTAVLVAAGPAAAATTVAPATIASAFTPTEVGVGDSTATALSITITNPNATAPLSAVAFTDTLPAGLTVDDPNGENGTCGSAGVITATPSGSTISLTGGSLKGATSCAISVSVVASQTGTLSNSTGPVSSSAGSSATGDTQTLTVLPPPTLAVTGIKNKATYSFGQVVRPKYSCTQPSDPTALADCSAGDDLGDTIASGGKLNTTTPGAHTLTVVATSTDGLSTTDNIIYRVLPDSRFTITNVAPKRHGALGFVLALPGPGTIKVLELGPKHAVVGSDTVKVTQKRHLKVDLKPTKAGVKLLTPAKGSGGSAKGSGAVKLGVKLEVSFTPKGGVQRTVTQRGIELTSK
jgi:hypothetical protein